MKVLKYTLLYAFSVMLSNLFYFHNSLWTMDTELFIEQCNNYPIIKIYVLAIGILLLIIVFKRLNEVKEC